VALFTIIVDGQVLAILLVGELQCIDFKVNSDYYDYNYDDDDVLHFELAGFRYCFYCLQSAVIKEERIIGTAGADPDF